MAKATYFEAYRGNAGNFGDIWTVASGEDLDEVRDRADTDYNYLTDREKRNSKYWILGWESKEEADEGLGDGCYYERLDLYCSVDYDITDANGYTRSCNEPAAVEWLFGTKKFDDLIDFAAIETLTDGLNMNDDITWKQNGRVIEVFDLDGNFVERYDNFRVYAQEIG